MALQNLSRLFPFLFVSLRVIALYSIMGLLQPTLFTAATIFSNETDRFALLKFKESIPIDPNGVLSSWNDSVPFCDWPGISCNVRHQRVTALELEGYNLRGTISPYIGNLSFMRSLKQKGNS